MFYQLSYEASLVAGASSIYVRSIEEGEMMCVCVCVCVCLYMHVCMYVCMYALSKCVWMDGCTYVCVCTADREYNCEDHFHLYASSAVHMYI